MISKSTIAIISLTLACSACVQREPENVPRKPQQAGQPLNSARMAAQIAAIRASAIVGDQKSVEKNMKAINEDIRKSLKLADPANPVDRELARQAARKISGVRSVVWLDRENFFVIVDKNELRSYETIDNICLELEPLGDTLGVVVNLQSGAATNGDELEILSRNCQLQPGERGFLQRERKVDVIDPEIRKIHKANNATNSN